MSPAPFALKFLKGVRLPRARRKSLPGADASQAEKGKHSDLKVVIRRRKKINGSSIGSKLVFPLDCVISLHSYSAGCHFSKLCYH